MSIANRSRRLGERLDVSGIVVDWNVGATKASLLRRRRRDRADVIDVSVTGAQLLAPSNERLAVGDTLVIGAYGDTGTVQIRRISPVNNGKISVFGVEFLELEPALAELLFTTIAETRPTEVDVVWQRGI